MMRKRLTTALLGLLMAAAPLALAQEEKPTSNESLRPDDAARVEGCPPGSENCRGEEDVLASDDVAGKDAPFAGAAIVAGSV